MSETRWKAQERRISHLLKAHRASSPGMSTPDVVNAWLCVEVKDRKLHPKWLADAVRKNKGHATIMQLPVVVLTSRYEDLDLVVLDLADFRKHFVG